MPATLADDWMMFADMQNEADQEAIDSARDGK